MKPGRLWHPLDVEFWDDPDTLAVGESAAVLFLRLIAYAKKHQTDGWVPMAYVRQIGGRRWQTKLDPIVRQGWATLTDETAPNGCHAVTTLADICGAKWCHVVAFLAWNDSSEDVEQRREIAREKKRKQRSALANVPQGQAAPVPSHRVEVESRVETDSSPNGEECTPTTHAPNSFEARRGYLLRAHRDRYEAATANPVPSGKNSPQAVDQVTAWLAGYALRTGQSFPDAVEAVLGRWWADPYTASKGWPLALLAKDVDQFAEALPVRLAKATGGMVPVSSREEHAADAAEGTAF